MKKKNNKSKAIMTRISYRKTSSFTDTNNKTIDVKPVKQGIDGKSRFDEGINHSGNHCPLCLVMQC